MNPALEKTPSTFWKKEWGMSLMLVALVLVAYMPAWNGSALWDDEQHLIRPGLYSLDGLRQIWTQPGATQQYYPLVHSLFWVEYRLWEYRTTGYHFVNMLLHAGCALLLLRILRKLEFPAAALAAAIFAFHPVEVESVAWISEIKNTLSGILYLGAALAYLNYDGRRKRVFYFLALTLFILALLSKTVVATLPAALLVVFWWKRGCLSWKRDALPLVPFFITGIVSGLFTAWVEKKYIGADGSEFAYSLVERALIAGRAFWFYLGKLFWPVDLTFIYPRWNVSNSEAWQYLFPALAIVLLAGLWFVRRRSRGPMAAMLFFAGTLFPALGFFNVYPFKFSFVADHFQYLAGIGPITLAAAAIALVARRAGKIHAAIPCVLYTVLLAVLFVLTWRQSRMYSDNETLWQVTTARNPGSWVAHDNLGVALLRAGDVEGAIQETREALILRPDSAETYSNLGNALIQALQIDDGIENYEKSLALDPDNQATHYNLGTVLLHQKHQIDGAVFHLAKCVEIEHAKGRPENPYAHYDLGVALAERAHYREAAGHYRKALELLPHFTPAEGKLAWILATCPDAAVRDGRQAVALALESNDAAGGRDPNALKILAAAYAEAGQYPEAVKAAQEAMAIATMMHDAVLVDSLDEQLSLYQVGKPFHEDL